MSDRTDVIVVGRQSPHSKAEKQKLVDVEYGLGQGHALALIKLSAASSR